MGEDTYGPQNGNIHSIKILLGNGVASIDCMILAVSFRVPIYKLNRAIESTVDSIEECIWHVG